MIASLLFCTSLFSLHISELPTEVLDYIGSYIRCPIDVKHLDSEYLDHGEVYDEFNTTSINCLFFEKDEIKSLIRQHYDHIKERLEKRRRYCPAQDLRGSFSKDTSKIIVVFYKKRKGAVFHQVAQTLSSEISLFNTYDNSIQFRRTIRGKVESIAVSNNGLFCIYCLAPDRDDSEDEFSIVLDVFSHSPELNVATFANTKLSNLSKIHFCSIPFCPLVSLTSNDEKLIVCVPNLDALNDNGNINIMVHYFDVIRLDNTLQTHFVEKGVCKILSEGQAAVITKGIRTTVPLMVMWKRKRVVCQS